VTARREPGDARDVDVYVDVEFLDLNSRSVMIDDEVAFGRVMDVEEGRLDVDGIAGILGAALAGTQEP